MNALTICQIIENELLKKYGTLYKAHKVLNVPLGSIYKLRSRPSYDSAFRFANAAGIALKVEVM
ncbi:hypothetical protein L9F34_000309 [Klebsiella aerogenes]|uniref:hypothetical protein n=1 Tax=Klebsiella TaxID=570 RepID=UPI000F7E7C20|nr:hypothetical protein [Klebsiella aerogenes]EKV3390529.1 hypothetical protein [Klebsiella aerogenes]EMF0746006.1 hypothetical protein [Klebsiella aerogenes]MEB6079527.1 hypothetical protein [Klebsiella aerogenes]RSW53147.1 hypothetical protein EGH44_06245 [Klebsiella aerogenes]HCM5149399.1 hypothetical protein [Klebsiella aerogenes]